MSEDLSELAGGHWPACPTNDPSGARECNCPVKHGIPHTPPREDFAPFPPMPDYVNNPPHYTKGEIECIDAIKAALTPDEFRGFCKGNALKYVWRERHKGGPESLEKAVWYMDRAAGKARA